MGKEQALRVGTTGGGKNKREESKHPTKAAKEATIDTIKTVSKHTIDWATGKTRAREKAAEAQNKAVQELISKREVEMYR